MTLPRGPVKAVFPDSNTSLPPRIDLLILGVSLIVAACFVAADVFQRWVASDPIETFNIDGRSNPVTWFQSSLLLGAALCCIGIALTVFNRPLRAAWLGLAPVLAFFSLDKAISVHERVGSKLEDHFGLPDDAGRLAWQMAWLPMIVAGVALLVVCLLHANRRTQLWALALAAASAFKLASEALMFPALRYWDVTRDSANFYGVEVNIEETIQLIGFACLFAGLAQLFFDRFWAFARGEIEALEREHARDSFTIPLLTRRVMRRPSDAIPSRAPHTTMPPVD